MKVTIKVISVVLVLLITLGTSTLKAQEKNGTTFSIETDPFTFAFKGYAFHVRIKPKNSQHVVLGAGTYGLNMPAFLVNMNKENKDKGWNVNIKNAVSLFGEYYFKEANQKWFLGLQAGIQTFKISNSNLPHQTAQYSNLLLMPSIGYNWHPLKNNLYIKPWLGIGYTTKISGDNNIQNLKYAISPMSNFLTVHLGYTFK
jgi:outer membrane protein W